MAPRRPGRPASLPACLPARPPPPPRSSLSGLTQLQPCALSPARPARVAYKRYRPGIPRVAYCIPRKKKKKKALPYRLHTCGLGSPNSRTHHRGAAAKRTAGGRRTGGKRVRRRLTDRPTAGQTDRHGCPGAAPYFCARLWLSARSPPHWDALDLRGRQMHLVLG